MPLYFRGVVFIQFLVSFGHPLSDIVLSILDYYRWSCLLFEYQGTGPGKSFRAALSFLVRLLGGLLELVSHSLSTSVASSFLIE